jgi:tetratricopeptide (TPR) repeat protein
MAWWRWRINRAHQLKLTPIQVGRLWAELAYAYQDLMQYSNAEAAYTHSLALLEREPDDAGDYSDALSNLGSLYVRTAGRMRPSAWTCALSRWPSGSATG